MMNVAGAGNSITSSAATDLRHDEINPKRIVPIGPIGPMLDLDPRHGRERLTAAN
jgi:glutathionyl-hydroquinone reductase